MLSLRRRRYVTSLALCLCIGGGCRSGAPESAAERSILERVLEDAGAAQERFARAHHGNHARTLDALETAGFEVPEGVEFEIAAINNTRILGIFARLIVRDAKPRYGRFMRRVWNHLEGDLKAPGLEGLKAWFDAHAPMDVREAA